MLSWVERMSVPDSPEFQSRYSRKLRQVAQDARRGHARRELLAAAAYDWLDAVRRRARLGRDAGASHLDARLTPELLRDLLVDRHVDDHGVAGTARVGKGDGAQEHVGLVARSAPLGRRVRLHTAHAGTIDPLRDGGRRVHVRPGPGRDDARKRGRLARTAGTRCGRRARPRSTRRPSHRVALACRRSMMPGMSRPSVR